MDINMSQIGDSYYILYTSNLIVPGLDSLRGSIRNKISFQSTLYWFMDYP
jgi:hypothetical protein